VADDAQMEQDIARQIGELVAANDRIGAIRVLREATGMGLAEAKAVIETVADGGSFPAGPAPVRPAPDPNAIPAEVRQIAVAGNRIHAIKMLREHFGLGLKEAKDLLDQAVPVAATAGKRGCLLPLLFGAMIGSAGFLLS
jgi:ribosomal protein L7/L12